MWGNVSTEVIIKISEKVSTESYLEQVSDKPEGRADGTPGYADCCFPQHIAPLSSAREE